MDLLGDLVLEERHSKDIQDFKIAWNATVLILMELQDWNGALKYCILILPLYHRIYPSSHPLLRLQYYTCGKLE
ncbi:hypothetical protein Sjap_024339 [Stephania japonica]|uniref:Uncharacterized protein n=1 Tax=Stephania japonica TaxID=461633 RepID=A0AAP0EGF8_9MAGN